jgi:hypothetical protein
MRTRPKQARKIGFAWKLTPRPAGSVAKMPSIAIDIEARHENQNKQVW